MGIINIYKRFTWFTGVLAAALAWIIIFTCIYINPWFIFTVHAFSDLGSPNANMPWLYNYGLITVGIIILLYSLYLLIESMNKLESMGSSFIFIAGIFLILIGIYPSGTDPHVFVSTWFFLQADLAIIVWGLGLIYRNARNIGYFFTAMGILGPIIAMMVDWPSAATVEAYGIVIIDIWVILLTWLLKKR